LLGRIFPGSTGKDKQSKLEMLDSVFGTTSSTALGEMKIEDLQKGYKGIMDGAVKLGLAEYVEVEGKKRLVPVATNGNGK